MSISVHYKPTDSYSCLRYDSHHPDRCRDSIPYSQFLCLRHICSEDEDFAQRTEEMKDFFFQSCYPQRRLENSFYQVKLIKRSDTLHSNPLDRTSNKIPLVLTYNEVNVKIAGIICKNARILRDNDEVTICSIITFLLPLKMIGTSFKNDRNLAKHVIRSHLPEDEIPGMFPCGRSRCKTCFQILNTVTVVGPNGSVDIKKSFQCTTKGIIYCVTCLRCGDLYIGETGRMLADRFREHLADIRNAKVGKEFASHFNQAGHTIDDVAVSGISYQPMISQRRIKKARLIRNIDTLVPLA